MRNLAIIIALGVGLAVAGCDEGPRDPNRMRVEGDGSTLRPDAGGAGDACSHRWIWDEATRICEERWDPWCPPASSMEMCTVCQDHERDRLRAACQSDGGV